MKSKRKPFPEALWRGGIKEKGPSCSICGKDMIRVGKGSWLYYCEYCKYKLKLFEK